MGDRIILIDCDSAFLQSMAEKLRAIGYQNVVLTDHAAAAVEALEKGETFDLALIDISMPDMDGVALLEHVKNTSPGTECIMVTAINDARTAVACLRKGAYDYLVKPVAQSVLSLTLPRALERKRLLDILDVEKRRYHDKLNNPTPFSPIITQAPVMLRVLKEAELHAASNVPILITGESGSGKELLAWAIHTASPRSSFLFSSIKMASISANIIKNAFFGNPRDAESTEPRRGYLELAHKGTLFLDEIGDLPLELQGRLLEILQEGEFLRSGGKERIRVDLRFMAATNEDLDDMILRKAFRKDLYYWIRGGWLHLPPLRERSGDITLLTQVFLNKYQHDSRTADSISPQALDILNAYPWPGNVRELRAAIQSAANQAHGQRLEPSHLPGYLQALTPSKSVQPPAKPAVENLNQRIRPLADQQKDYILWAYQQMDYNKSKTARVLDIGLNTLRRKLAEYGRA